MCRRNNTALVPNALFAPVTRRVLTTSPHRRLYPSAELCYNPNIEHITPLSKNPASASAGTQAAPRFPAPAYQGQDAVFGRAFHILQEAIARAAFPAASVAVTYQGKLVALKAFGRFTYEPSSPAVTVATVFDLASVSKVVATTTMAMILYERGLIDLEAPVASIVPEFAGSDPRRGEVTVRMLLAHSSGLPAYEKLFLKQQPEMNCWRRHSPLRWRPIPAREPNTATSASSFWRLRWSGSPMRALTVSASGKYSGRWGWRTPPTIRRQRGGLRFRPPRMTAPSANGLSRAKCRMKTPACWVESQDMPACSRPRKTWLHLLTFFCREERRWFVRKRWRSSLAAKLRRPALPVHWVGTRLPRHRSRGNIFPPVHSGIWDTPGTSLWIDPERQLSVTLLTNRTWPDCENKAIKDVRPAFHDAVVEALERKL